MKNRGFLLVLVFFAITISATAQTSLGINEATKVKVLEYYNHAIEQEWIKIFRIYNHNPAMGFWKKGGVSGTVYFVSYDGEGGSYVDFSFPQHISEQQRPVLQMSGNSANNFTWHAQKSSDGPGQEYYEVFIKTPPAHVGFTFMFRGADYEIYGTKTEAPQNNVIWSSTTHPQSIAFYVGNGNIGLGTLDPSEKLSVNGNIRAQEIKVEASNWPDYVFSPSHEKLSLKDLEVYINDNRHLPEIPSAKQVEDKGLSLGEMNGLLLKKIEELTLYLIEQEKRSEKQESRIRELERLIKP
ncbi:hypothetical protein B0I27_11620 [Arcticibacter pallidicorallinus]|uniref:Uncharacterized protein n=1 Tax=Arcticibacter pallidicorallinus TaxID=1259464 RepID=A0A2T0TQY8_9SPHI|nr:hypothetical protein [Arcticibacter pallidicorallinus]PRY48086.1 hypothetical protein B0I27_11620 [Arcticibacter pallidicorallinus]